MDIGHNKKRRNEMKCIKPSLKSILCFRFIYMTMRIYIYYLYVYDKTHKILRLIGKSTKNIQNIDRTKYYFFGSRKHKILLTFSQKIRQLIDVLLKLLFSSFSQFTFRANFFYTTLFRRTFYEFQLLWGEKRTTKMILKK